MSKRRFVIEGLRTPTRIGAIWPSSGVLARSMVEWVNWPAVSTVVEYGPGDGAFTSHIRNAMQPHARYLAIEQSAGLVDEFRKRFPDADIAQGSVADVRSICAARGISRVDAVICGLPWAAWKRDVQEHLVRETLGVMQKDGQFTTFAYLQGLLLPGGRSFRALLERTFNSVGRSPVVWRNVPPAIAYRCTL